jgi:hypothetical protein
VVLLDRRGKLRFTEQTFLPDAMPGGRVDFSFQIFS